MSTEEHAKPQESEWRWMDYHPRERVERMITHGMQLLSTLPVEWIVELDQSMKYISCARPEHSVSDAIDIETMVKRSIALDTQVMARCAERRSNRPRRSWP